MPPQLDVGRTLVTSFGGVGTSELLEAFGAAGAQTNDPADCDGVKFAASGREDCDVRTRRGRTLQGGLLRWHFNS